MKITCILVLHIVIKGSVRTQPEQIRHSSGTFRSRDVGREGTMRCLKRRPADAVLSTVGSDR